ncbi:LysR family transcriptional regulator [Streptomyces sp. PCS3-D2]|nr:LysR family transcriptional regulator [Streptomyces sp. PCS3-D2]
MAVAEEGGFGRAAQRLGIVPSAVSQQIGRLERGWGVVLFERTTRRVRLSSAGERLLPEARAVLAAAERTVRVAADVTAGADGVLRLGGVHGPRDRLGRVLALLSAAAPRLQVRLRRMPVGDRLAAVRSGELDAALVRAVPSAAGLELLPLWSDPLHVALPQGHPLAAERAGGWTVWRGSRCVWLRARRTRTSTIWSSTRAAGRGRAARRAALRRSAGHARGDRHGARGVVDRLLRGPGDAVGPAVVVRPLAGLSVTTSLAVRPGPPDPALRHLLAALHRVEGAVGPAGGVCAGRRVRALSGTCAAFGAGSLWPVAGPPWAGRVPGDRATASCPPQGVRAPGRAGCPA